MFYDIGVSGLRFREGVVSVRGWSILVAFSKVIRLEKITVSSDDGCAGA
jgi:hypothetical protein